MKIGPEEIKRTRPRRILTRGSCARTRRGNAPVTVSAAPPTKSRRRSRDIDMAFLPGTLFVGVLMISVPTSPGSRQRNAFHRRRKFKADEAGSDQERWERDACILHGYA